MDARDSLQLFDLDKGGEQLGPLFEEPRRRLQEDSLFRAAWNRYQAVRALAWEAAPDLDDRLIRQGLQAGRRQEVERRLARAMGSQDAARELLLSGGAGKQGGVPAWAALLLLLGALGLGWMAFGPKSDNVEAGARIEPAKDLKQIGSAGTEAMAFEFPIPVSPSAAAPAATPGDDETHRDSAATQSARRLVNENLQEAAQSKTPRARARRRRRVRSALAPVEVPSSSPTPSLEPTVEASPVSTATATPTPAPPVLIGSVVTGLTVTGNQFPVDVVLTLAEPAAVDLRLFDMRGQLVRQLAGSSLAAGAWPYHLAAVDDQGVPLPKGSYYLRATTPSYSKVETLEQP